MELSITLNDLLWRPLTADPADTNFVVALRNTAVVQAALFSGPITHTSHTRFLNDGERQREVNWIVEHRGQRVGTTGIYRIDERHRRAEVGRLMVTSPEIFHSSCLVSLFAVFDCLSLNKLYCEALASNEVANRAYSRLGLTREGVLREQLIKDGTFADVWVYGMLAAEWRESKGNLLAPIGQPRVVSAA